MSKEPGHNRQPEQLYAEIEAANIQAVEDAERALTTALATQVGNAVTAMPEAAARITRAARLVQKRDVYPLSSGNFLWEARASL